MIYKYSIPEVPSSLNEFLGRDNKWEYRQQKCIWEQLVAACCRPKPKKPIEKAIVTLVFHFRTRQRHDPDNYTGGSKPLMDGLVRAGIIKDDSFDCIELRAKQGDVDAKGRVDVIVEDIGQVKFV